MGSGWGDGVGENREFNRSFSSFVVPQFQNESSFKTFHMKMNLICMEMNI